jgi:hypothetical protein
LRADVAGEPRRVYLCFCQDCQRLSGTTYAYRALFDAAQVSVSGERSVWRRPGRSGSMLAHAFCPGCGSTVLCWSEARPDILSLSVGGFEDAHFSAPVKAFWTARKHAWLPLPPDVESCEYQ